MEIGDVVKGPCVHKEVGEVQGVVYCKYPSEGSVGVLAAPAFVRGYCCMEKTLQKLPDETLDEKTLKIAKLHRAQG